jgi:hypothetical protein
MKDIVILSTVFVLLLISEMGWFYSLLKIAVLFFKACKF